MIKVAYYEASDGRSLKTPDCTTRLKSNSSDNDDDKPMKKQKKDHVEKNNVSEGTTTSTAQTKFTNKRFFSSTISFLKNFSIDG